MIGDWLFEPCESPDGFISPIWVNENRIDITTKPTSLGKAVEGKWRPKTTAYTVKSVPKNKDTILEVDDSKPGVMHISGQIAAGSGPGGRGQRPGGVRPHGLYRGPRTRRYRGWRHAEGLQPFGCESY